MGSNQFGWKSLADSLRDRAVVPIFGPDAVLVSHRGQTAPFHHFLADRVRASWRDADGALPAASEPGLPALIRGLLALPENLERNRDLIMVQLRSRLVEAHQSLTGEVVPTPDMRALAALGRLPLFVTTSIDGGLDLAMKAAELKSPSLLNVKRITTRTAEDLPERWEEAETPTVYHLFGRIDGEMTFALGDDEIIESFYKLHGAHAPSRLITALADHDKLLLGTGLPDWLFRFLFRLAKGRAYAERPMQSFEVVAEEHLRTGSQRHDPGLLGFLRQFPGGTWIAEDDPPRFLAGLMQPLASQRPSGSTSAGASAPAPPSAGRRPPGHVFISYSYEDKAVAERLVQQLEGKCPVWFDRRRFQGGEELTLELRAAIERAHLFVPLISRHTNASAGPKVFVEEWKHALEWIDRIQLGLRPYIVPVIVDDLTPDALAGEALKFTSRKLDLTFRTVSGDTASLGDLVTDLQTSYQKVEMALHGLPPAS